MIKLTFELNKEIMRFRIDWKSIYYSDRLWQNELRCVPRDENFIAKIRNSRNKYSAKLIDAFSLNQAQQAEYDSAKNEEEIANIIIRDMTKKGGKLIKRE